MNTTQSTDTTTASIKLNCLTAWEGNVRKTGADNGIAELSASIAAHGLLQSLVVRKDKRGRYAVVAGRRRLLALKALAEAGTVAADMDVPCHLIAGDANATEISLVENAVREQMHPADEFDAFLALREGGMQTADIAARFGVTETVVRQRLKLAAVSPVILAAYRRDEMSLAHVMAYAVTDDHEAQERVRDDLSDWQRADPDDIRAALTEGEVTAKDRRVKFVTLKAYEKAGGAVRRDLFSQDDNGVFIQDVVLLESLVAKKLEKTAVALRKDGWKWVEVRASYSHAEWSKCGRRFAEAPPLPADLQAEHDALSREYNELIETTGNNDDNLRLAEIEDRITALEDREAVWSPEVMAISGAIVTIGYDGKAQTHLGYVRPEDAPKKSAKAKLAETSDGGSADGETSGCALSAPLIESLTMHRTAALAAALKDRPDIALAAVVYTIAQKVHYAERGATALMLSASTTRHGLAQDSIASGAIEKARHQWGDRLPGNPEDLWAWCLAQDRNTLLDLLAFCAASTVNAVQQKGDRAGGDRLAHADQLAAALNLDMTAWFTPTAENYFGRVTKAGIIDALREGKGAVAPAWEKAGKADLAAIAERELSNTGWLPPPLRRAA